MNKPEIRVVGGVFFRQGALGVPEVLMFRRRKGETGAGLYEFPGGKIELGESDQQALKRELYEELGVDVVVKEFIGESVYEAPSRFIRLRIYYVQTPHFQWTLTDHDDEQWWTEEQIDLDKIVPADRPLIPQCFSGLKLGK